MPSGSSSRWCPTPEQVTILQELYRNGMSNPNATQIQRISAHLSVYGRIEGKNVFYWFQNHKARERQKFRKKLMNHQQQYKFLDQPQIFMQNNSATRHAFFFMFDPLKHILQYNYNPYLPNCCPSLPLSDEGAAEAMMALPTRNMEQVTLLIKQMAGQDLVISKNGIPEDQEHSFCMKNNPRTTIETLDLFPTSVTNLRANCDAPTN